uniref:Recep_L_domain domain-containing protein n=1 Tax=Caenorhabditis tropicalis TaxID=1561998 RepID=A0A1I7UV09_9PELO
MPLMPNLKEIVSDGVRPGVIILNNPNLQDVRGFVNWDKEVKVTGNEKFPVFISGNRELDTINLPKLFHNPLSPISCEKRMVPFYNIQFAETISLTTVLSLLIFTATCFLYTASLGSWTVYFVPGYHEPQVFKADYE